MTSIVLIVEDDEILRSPTVEAISLRDLRVVDCASADDVLIVPKATLQRPHLAVQPVATGAALRGQMRQLVDFSQSWRL